MSFETTRGEETVVRIRTCLVFGMVLLASTVTAAQSDVETGKPGYLDSRSSDIVLIFKNVDALLGFVELRRTGDDSELVVRYFSCVVPVGTKVLNITGEVTEGGRHGTSDVMVITGPNAGCRGVVPSAQLKATPPPVPAKYR